MFINILFKIIIYFITIIPLLIAVAYFTLIERHILAAIQRRQGPNIVGFFGILQPISDGIKLFIKECILPKSANYLIFIFAPIFTFCTALSGLVFLPFDINKIPADVNLSILYILTLSSFSVHTIILSGWSSNSKYAFLGSLRSAAQMISYEIAMGLSIFSVLIFTGSYSLTNIVITQKQMWNIIPLFPCFIIFFLCALAETNRHPFDLPEAEAELVAGYNVEYSAMTFALFFLAEYSNIIIICIIIVLLFLGGWLPLLNFKFIPNVLWLIIKSVIFIMLFIIIRGVLPRYRYDQLMSLGWKVYIPGAFFYFFFIAIFLINFDFLT